MMAGRDIVVETTAASKKYCRSLRRSMWYGFADLTRDVLGVRGHSDRLRPQEFWAVDEVSVKVERGECLGMVGPNGAGKSTLLKMLHGLIRPDKGTICIRGRTAPLIEVGAGFHPQLTGRENIYINAAILGLSKAETDQVFDAIVDFADLGDYIDSPVKFYSSGMYVRLGMAVALHTRPEVLLVDEVFAVGDIRFQSRCLSRIAELRRNGTSILLVSHNMDTITGYSDRVLVLHKGQPYALDKPGLAVEQYLELMEDESTDTGGEEIHPNATGDVTFRRVRFVDGNGEILSDGGRLLGVATASEPISLLVDYDSERKHQDVELLVGMYDGKNLLFTRTSNVMLEQSLTVGPGSGSLVVDFPCIPKNNGTLHVTLTLWSRDRTELLEWRRGERLKVRGCGLSAGDVWLPCRFRSTDDEPGTVRSLEGEEERARSF